MNKAIFRIQKLKSKSSVAGCLKHNFRAINTPNADPDRLHENEVLAGPETARESSEEYDKALPENIRKNAVMAIECLSTASPEFFETASPETQKQFFADSLKFIENKFGKENIISAVIHRDESTPHLQTLVIPLKDGKLNAKSYLGGSKYELSKLQTDFHASVEKHGLERGQIRSKASHVAVKDFYTDIDTTAKKTAEIVSENIQLKDQIKVLLERIAELPTEIKNKILGIKNDDRPSRIERNSRREKEAEASLSGAPRRDGERNSQRSGEARGSAAQVGGDQRQGEEENRRSQGRGGRGGNDRNSGGRGVVAPTDRPTHSNDRNR
jgi:hypothetical protein